MKKFITSTFAALALAATAGMASADSLSVSMTASNTGDTGTLGANLAGVQLANQLVNGNQAAGATNSVSASDSSAVVLANAPLFFPPLSGSINVNMSATNRGDVTTVGVNGAYFQGAREITNVNAATGAGNSISATNNSIVAAVQ